MNNTLCLAVFAALVYFNELDWQFSAGEELRFLCQRLVTDLRNLCVLNEMEMEIFTFFISVTRKLGTY